MKVVHLCTSDRGGAGLAASRLHIALLRDGINSSLLTLQKYTDIIPRHYKFTSFVFSKFPLIDKLFLLIRKVLNRFGICVPAHIRLARKYLKNTAPGFELFSFEVSLNQVMKHPLVVDADVLHLHWISDGYIDFERFFKDQHKKIVWTLHDMNPFTGGCHHSDDCMGFVTGCLKCPQLKGSIDDTFSGKVLTMKTKVVSKLDVGQMWIVTPSVWLGELSAKSKLFQGLNHSVIANGVNTKVYKPYGREAARKVLNLPLDKKIVLYVSHEVGNERKGIRFLLEAYRELKSDNILFCSLGAKLISLEMENIHQFGYVSNDETIARIYSAADVFVLPSLAENFPNTICESLTCGTPIVAFPVGGIPELVNESNGLSIAVKSSDSLAKGILAILNNPRMADYERISNDASSKYSDSRMASAYTDIYQKLLGKDN